MKFASRIPAATAAVRNTNDMKLMRRLLSLRGLLVLESLETLPEVLQEGGDSGDAGAERTPGGH